jgi:hypothetical protein
MGYEGNAREPSDSSTQKYSSIGPRQGSANLAATSAPARITSAVEMALNHNAQVAADIREAALELRNRLAPVLPSHAHQDPPLTGAPSNKVEPPAVPVVQTIEEITATQHRTLDVLRTILQHVAL